MGWRHVAMRSDGEKGEGLQNLARLTSKQFTVKKLVYFPCLSQEKTRPVLRATCGLGRLERCFGALGA